ncbi:MAG: flagellin FliC [Oligoflexia bacterium]|nr:flagellin FliC [Oligoflexia bacterium]
MKVTSPNSSLNTLMANLRKTSDEEGGLLSKLSSGKRVEKSADDAAGLAMSKKITAFVESQKQAKRNAGDGLSFVQTAEGGLNEIGNILIRLRELSVQGASDTVGDNERGLIDKEYQSLVQEIDRIAESTSFNGTNVINGDGKGVLNFQVGSFAGEENILTFDTDETYADVSSLGLSGTGVSDKTDSTSNLEVIDEAINKVSGKRADMGALQSRIQHAMNNIENSIINHESMRSKIEDVDVAEASAKLASNNIRKRSAIAALAQGMDFPKSALKLIE